MPAPSRVQIEANIAQPTYRIDIWYPGTGWIELPDSSIVDVSGINESVGSQDNGLAFGTSVEPKATIQTEMFVVSTADKLISDTYWLMKRMRIGFGFETSDPVTVFVGPIRERRIDGDDVTIELQSNLEFVRNAKFYSPLYFDRPIATKTTAASVENPSSGSYVAGMINRILWEAGGRPYEQANINYFETDAAFRFWYSCEQALLTPDWSWVSSDNLVDDLFTLARAGGGQIYQDNNGVIRYVQPFSFADLSSYGPLYTPFEYTDAYFESYSESATSFEQVGTVACTYTPRAIQPLQVVYEDQTPRFLQPSESQVLLLETTWPVYEFYNMISDSELTKQAFTVTKLNGQSTLFSIGTVTKYATRIEIAVGNPSATEPIIIHAIKILGRPVTAEEEKIVSYGSGEPKRNIESNVYIQNERFASRMVRMVYDFYAHNRPIVTLKNAIYDPDRFVGELVTLDSYYNRVYSGGGYSSNNDLYRIINIRHSVTGTVMDVDLTVVTGLPTRDQMFLVGTSYLSANTRKLSY